MEDVKRHERHGSDVDQEDPPDLEGVVEVGINLAVDDRRGVNRSRRELQQVEDQEEEDRYRKERAELVKLISRNS